TCICMSAGPIACVFPFSGPSSSHRPCVLAPRSSTCVFVTSAYPRAWVAFSGVARRAVYDALVLSVVGFAHLDSGIESLGSAASQPGHLGIRVKQTQSRERRLRCRARTPATNLYPSVPGCAALGQSRFPRLHAGGLGAGRSPEKGTAASRDHDVG